MKQFLRATNAQQVTENIVEIHNRLCEGSMKNKEAFEIHNGVGKISSLLKTQLEYHKMRGEKPEIEFLNCHPTTKTIEHGAKILDAPKK